MNRSKKTGALLIALIILTVSVFSCFPASAEQTGVVFGGWLILRSSPSFSGKIKSSYPSGTVVTITGKTGSWYAVKTPDGLTGYMLGDYLKINGSGGGGGTFPSGSTVYVTSTNGLNVRLRSGPGTGYSIIATYAPGTSATMLSSGRQWCRIRIGSYTGYMMTKFLTSNPVTPTQPPTPPGPEYEVYVTSRNGKGVNLRSGPSKAYSSIGFYSVGTQAWMITKGSTWSYIRIGSRYGYMMTEFLTTTQPTPVPPIPGASYVVSANGRNVNLRSAPTTSSQIIRSFKVGTRLNIIIRGPEWCFIQIEGYYGYMMRQFIYDGGCPVPPAPPSPEPTSPGPPTPQPPPNPTPTPKPATQTDL